jgi:chromosome segregation ATPase
MKVTQLRPEAAHAVAELETLFQASRQVEASLLRERNQNGALATEMQNLRERHAQELARVRQHIQTLTERDATLIKKLKEMHARAHSIHAHAVQLKDQNTRLKAAVQEQSRKVDLVVTAARATLDHLRGKMRDQDEATHQLKLEVQSTRQELERAHAEVLEREHRYQAAVLNNQGREQSQQTAIHALKDQLKQLQAEHQRLKSRWIETEQKRQDSERRREEAELTSKGQSPAQEKLRKLEETNQMLLARLSEEKKLRKSAEGGMSTAEMNQEMNRMRSALLATEDRLAYTEAQLSKASAEASLMKAVQQHGDLPAFSERVKAESKAPSPEPIDFELLERLALPGYPIQDA